MPCNHHNLFLNAEYEEQNLDHKELEDTIFKVKESVNNLKNKTSADLSREVESLTSRIEQTAGTAHQELQDSVHGIRQNIDELSEQIDTEIMGVNSRVDNIIANSSATEGNSELIDIRTGVDGTVFQTAGNAVRSQILHSNNQYKCLLNGVVGSNIVLRSCIVSISLFGFDKAEKYFVEVFRKNYNNSGKLQIIIRDSSNNAICNYQGNYQSGVENIIITTTNAGNNVTLTDTQAIVVIIGHDDLDSVVNIYGQTYETAGISDLSVFSYNPLKLADNQVLTNERVSSLENTVFPISGQNSVVHTSIKALHIYSHQANKFGIVMLKKNVTNSGNMIIGIYPFDYTTEERNPNAFAIITIPVFQGVKEFTLYKNSTLITGGAIDGNEMVYLKINSDEIPDATNLTELVYSDCSICEGCITKIHEPAFDFPTALSVSANSFLTAAGHTPIITYIDDDTEISSIPAVKNICDNIGIKCTFACITSKLDTVNGLENLLQSYQREGYHITTHSKTHGVIWNQNNAAFDPDACESELIESVQRLQQGGFLDPDILVTPYGSYNSALVSKMKKWAVGMVRVGSNSAGVYTNHLCANGRYDIFRVKIDKANDLSFYQSIIDNASANGDWLVFYTHSAVAAEFDASLTQSVLQYALNKGIAIMTLNQALKQRTPLYNIYETFQ